jgi:hypothetical protein
MRTATEKATRATTAPYRGIETRNSRTIDFDTVCSIETLSFKTRGLAGVIEAMAVASRKEGGMSISIDALEGLHGMAFAAMVDAQDLFEKVWGNRP